MAKRLGKTNLSRGKSARHLSFCTLLRSCSFGLLCVCALITSLLSERISVLADSPEPVRPTLTPLPRQEITPEPIRPTLTPLPSSEITPPNPQTGTLRQSKALSYIRGMAYHDLNRNGQRDLGEPVFYGAWLKITGGGNWYICTHVDGYGNYDVVVSPGQYFVHAIQLQGNRPTTQQFTVTVTNTASLYNDLGYITDPDATLQMCDRYHP